MDPSRYEKLLQRYISAADAIGEVEPRAATDLDANDQDDDLASMQQLLASQARLLASALRARTVSSETTKVNLDLVLRRLQNLASVAMAKFYAYRHDLVPVGWRHLYTEALVLKSLHAIASGCRAGEEDEDDECVLKDDWLDSVVENLDRVLITTGGQGRTLGSRWIEETIRVLEEVWQDQSSASPGHERPSKRQRVAEATGLFSSEEPYGRPAMREDRLCPRQHSWTLDGFEAYMNDPDRLPQPVVVTDLMADWPAMHERPWRSVDYLLSRTLGGRRLVPVEVGRSYVDDGWGQEVIRFGNFIRRYITLDSPHAGSSSCPASDHQQETGPVGYLAQHDLFRQIPHLRNDTRTPDLCWADVPRHPSDPARDQPKLDAPQLNAWFGPARTITPLHCDGYHNLLCQAVGTKYVRLYPPSATANMRPRGPEHGVDMSNTSELDLGVIEGWDEVRGEDDGGDERGAHDREALRKELEALEYKECVLEPGDTLLIPIGWWHYVRSLSISFSVSFWWN